jgi:hypothetical protein
MQILKHIIGELPAWVKHSDVERLAWLNNLLQTLWPKLSIATEKYMTDWLQPLLDASKPPGFNSLDLAKFTLGSNPIKFAGIRYQHTDENLVRLDLEIKWAGNPEIVIEVCRKAFPHRLEVTNLRFSAILRIELTPLVPGDARNTSSKCFAACYHDMIASCCLLLFLPPPRFSPSVSFSLAHFLCSVPATCYHTADT